MKPPLGRKNKTSKRGYEIPGRLQVAVNAPDAEDGVAGVQVVQRVHQFADDAVQTGTETSASDDGSAYLGWIKVKIAARASSHKSVT